MNKDNETTSLAARKLSKFLIILVLAVYFHPISSIGNDAMSALTEDAEGILCPFAYQIHYLADIISVCILTLLTNTGSQKIMKTVADAGDTKEAEREASLESWLTVFAILGYAMFLSFLTPVNTAPRLAAYIVSIISAFSIC